MAKTIKIANDAYELLSSVANKRMRKGNNDIGDIASRAIRIYVNLALKPENEKIGNQEK